MKKRIDIVGLGYGDEKSLSIGIYEKLKGGEKIFLRTKDHPVVPWLKSNGLSFYSFDTIYTSCSHFDLVYRRIVDRLFEEASSTPMIYAVPGHPMVAERTTQILVNEAKQNNVEVHVYGGESFLDIAFSRLGIDPIEGFLVLDGNDFDFSMLNPKVHLLLGQVYSRMVASDVKLSLMEVYPDEYMIKIVKSLGIEKEEQILSVPLFELDRKEYFDNLTSVYVPKKEGIPSL